MNCSFGTTSHSAMDITTATNTTTTATSSHDTKSQQQTIEDEQYAQEGTILVHVLAAVLDRLCVANVSVAQTDPGQVTKFHAMKAPGIGILKYLERYVSLRLQSMEWYSAHRWMIDDRYITHPHRSFIQDPQICIVFQRMLCLGLDIR